MLNRIISSKLKTSRRLVIPRLGVFVVREDGKILFSELMRNDDGVLRAAVVEDRHISEAEAAAIIDRFAFEVRRTLDHRMPYRIEGFGTLQHDDRGMIVFVSSAESIEHRTAEKVKQSAEAANAGSYAENTATGGAEQQPKSRIAFSDEKPRRYAPKRRGGTDIFMIVAVIVALIAIAAIVYGAVRSGARDSEPITSTVETTIEEVPVSEMQPAEEKPATAEKPAPEIKDLSVPSGK